MKKINEIFYSIQGEGLFTGTPMVFIRFSGCNLKCDFCDTDHSKFLAMSDADILEKINQYPTNRVCLTGGEPTLQVDGGFIGFLHDNDKIVHIETNGLIACPSNVDFITVSPKMGISMLNQRYADELKVVYQGQPLDEWEEYQADHFYLSPCSGRNTTQVLNYVKENPKWNLNLQIHKILSIQ